MLFGYRYWPAIAAGALLFSFTDGAPFGLSAIGTILGINLIFSGITRLSYSIAARQTLTVI